MKYQCTKCGSRRVAGRPVKASCKDFEIDSAQTPKNPVKRSAMRKKVKNLYSYHALKRFGLRKYHQFCKPGWHNFDGKARPVKIKAT